MSILGTILRDVLFYGIFYGVFLFGLFSLARLAYVRSVPLRHKVVNHAAHRAAITMAATDRFIRDQEHELYPDEKHQHVNCTICGPGPLKQGMVPSKYVHPFFTKTMVEVLDGYGSWKVETLRPATAETAEMVSSKVIEPETGVYTGQHTMMLDLDFPVTLIESSTTGHHHLYADVRMSWKQYRGVLKAMRAAGLIEDGYYRAALRQGATMLRPPWVKKPVERASLRKSLGGRWDRKWSKNARRP
jgi:hypothetical protein